MNENPELIRINEKVVKRNPEAVKKPLKIEKPEISDEFKKMVTGEGEMISPYVDKNASEDEISELKKMQAKAEKDREEFYKEKRPNGFENIH